MPENGYVGLRMPTKVYRLLQTLVGNSSKGDGMGGKDAVKELLVVDPFAKVVVCSGYSDDPVLANCRQFGFVAAMAKPYTFSELQRIIAETAG